MLFTFADKVEILNSYFVAKHNDTGVAGEQIAADYLLENGYKILEKNWRFGKEEIDIIALLSGTIAIVEVKTRSSSGFGNPEDFVNRKKQRLLIKAANAYIESKNFEGEVRFDIISIIVSGEQKTINHLEDAFRPIA